MNTFDKTESERQSINVFAYGSLMYAEVFEEVTGCLPLSIASRADGWQRFGLTGLAYPGARPVKEQAGFINGVLWLDVNQASLDALDRFEGEQYRRVLITVVAEGGRRYQAYIYEWLLPDLMQGDWDPKIFEHEHRHGFAQTHAARLE